MKRLYAVVPVRSLRNGKTRLSPVLSPEARATLLRRAGENVIRAALASGVVESVLVVSAGEEVLTWATGLGPGVVPLLQPEWRPGLNGAIDAGREWAREQKAAAMLSLFADLPLLTPEEIRSLAAQPEHVVLGPDRRGQGTNALLLRLRGRGVEFAFAFGEGSLARHLDEAKRLGLDTGIHTAPGIGFDLDTPDDWEDFLALSAANETQPSPPLVCCGAAAG